MKAPATVRLLTSVTDTCREADPSDWSPAECDAVLEGLGDVSREVVGLSARIRAARILFAGGAPCDEPPDLAGLCMGCGRKTAEPVTDLKHKPGCDPLARLRRICIRVSRLVRSAARAA